MVYYVTLFAQNVMNLDRENHFKLALVPFLPWPHYSLITILLSGNKIPGPPTLPGISHPPRGPDALSTEEYFESENLVLILYIFFISEEISAHWYWSIIGSLSVVRTGKWDFVKNLKFILTLSILIQHHWVFLTFLISYF